MKWLLACALALAPAALLAQTRYDIYGDPVDVSITSLVEQPSAYDGKAVRTKGRLEPMMSGGQSGVYKLADGLAYSIYIVPVREVASAWESEALRMTGRTLEVTGLFNAGTGGVGADLPAGNGTRPSVLQFWKYLGPPEEVKGEIKAESVSLESLVSRPGRYDGRTIRIFGRFRGKNLYGDLPSHSERDSHDWVIKDDVFAVWVTGRRPKGPGFELDADLKRDTEKWMEVVGSPETVRGVTYLRALKVSLGGPPPANVASGTGAISSTGATAEPAPVPEKPKVAPVVVFALPLDGDAEVPSNGRFQIQFSKDMDGASFKGRVVIRYAGAPRVGDRSFDGAKMTYDEGLRALTVEPGDVLRPGRGVEIVLLPGIKDIDGLELVARPGKESADAGVIDVLRYRVLLASLFGSNP